MSNTHLPYFLWIEKKARLVWNFLIFLNCVFCGQTLPPKNKWSVVMSEDEVKQSPWNPGSVCYRGNYNYSPTKSLCSESWPAQTCLRLLTNHLLLRFQSGAETICRLNLGLSLRELCEVTRWETLSRIIPVIYSLVKDNDNELHYYQSHICPKLFLFSCFPAFLFSSLLVKLPVTSVNRQWASLNMIFPLQTAEETQVKLDCFSSKEITAEQ